MSTASSPAVGNFPAAKAVGAVLAVSNLGWPETTSLLPTSIHTTLCLDVESFFVSSPGFTSLFESRFTRALPELIELSKDLLDVAFSQGHASTQFLLGGRKLRTHPTNSPHAHGLSFSWTMCDLRSSSQITAIMLRGRPRATSIKCNQNTCQICSDLRQSLIMASQLGR
jgi:hypothetical protein